MEHVIYKLFQTFKLIKVQLPEDVWDSFYGYLCFIFAENYSLLKRSDWVVLLSMMREALPGIHLQKDLKSCILPVHRQYLPLSSCYVQLKLERNTLLWFFFQPFPEDKELFGQGNPCSLTYRWNQSFMSHSCPIACFMPHICLRFMGIWWKQWVCLKSQANGLVDSETAELTFIPILSTCQMRFRPDARTWLHLHCRTHMDTWQRDPWSHVTSCDSPIGQESEKYY